MAFVVASRHLHLRLSVLVLVGAAALVGTVLTADSSFAAAAGAEAQLYGVTTGGSIYAVDQLLLHNDNDEDDEGEQQHEQEQYTPQHSPVQQHHAQRPRQPKGKKRRENSLEIPTELPTPAVETRKEMSLVATDRLVNSSRTDVSYTLVHPLQHPTKIPSANATSSTANANANANATCRDLRMDCVSRSRAGDCVTHAKYMHPHCPVSCGVCDSQTTTVPVRQGLEPMSRKVYQTIDDVEMLDAVGAKLGVPQYWPDSDDEQEAVATRLLQAEVYMLDEVQEDRRYDLVRNMCRNLHPECTYWAAVSDLCQDDDGEPDDYMATTCAPVCFTCHYLHVDSRCPPSMARNYKNAWYPGDLDRMFERILTDPQFQQYSPTVLSRPSYAEGDDEFTADYQLGPWVMQLDDFIDAEERRRLIEWGSIIGYERSTDVGDTLPDGTDMAVVSTGRTSMNAWCDDKCGADVHDVVKRLEHLTGIPYNYAEWFQLLQYEKGQFYERHHDYIDNEEFRIEGPRILTVYMYLNDVIQGGETRFTDTKPEPLTVEPKAGRCILWPSVLNDDPFAVDIRTMHQALPVIKGVKYGANAWFHQRPYQTLSNKGCF